MTEQLSPWKPNEEYLEALISMGISKTTAEHALFCTENKSLEAAASYAFDSLENEEEEILHFDVAHGSHVLRSDKLENCKMVFVVNSSLEMGVGKAAAQVAHACLGLYRNLSTKKDYSLTLSSWEFEGEKKVVLKGLNQEHLEKLQERANDESIETCLICDAGRTQIPSGSVTCLALFGEEKKIDSITGDLKLL